MRIALIHYTCLPVIGGVEFILDEHARLFAEAGHEVTLICRTGASRDPRIRFEALDADARRLRSLCEDQDIVIAHNIFTMPFAPEWTEALWNLAHQLPNVRFISWIHDLAACNPDYQIAPGSLLAKAHPRVEHVTISEYRRRQFEWLTRASCQVIPNGIDPGRLLGLTDPVLQLALQFDLFGSRLVLLHPSRLLPRKNVELDLRVAAALKARGRDCCMLITGPPDAQNSANCEYTRSLHQLRAELGVEQHTLFLHDRFPVSQADLNSLFSLADALFFPSRQEGFGLPILEAAVHRLPIFCADIAPMSSLLDHTLRSFAPDAHPNDIADLILHCLDRSREIQARKTVCRDYSWDSLYKKFLAPLLQSAPCLTPP